MHRPEFFAMTWYTPVPTERLPLPIMTFLSLQGRTATVSLTAWYVDGELTG